MKKIFALALAAAMALTALVGCASEKPEAGNADVDLNEFYASVEESMIEELGEENAPILDPMEGEMLDMSYPGLSELDLEQCVVRAPMMSAVVAEFAMAEAKDADQAAQVAEIFQARIDAQVNGGAWYPETIESWENDSTIVTNGNYVLMVAMEGGEKYVEAFNDLFK